MCPPSYPIHQYMLSVLLQCETVLLFLTPLPLPVLVLLLITKSSASQMICAEEAAF